MNLQQLHPLTVTSDRSWRQAGFTLIETMIVVAIIGILAAIAYPSYLSHVTKANRVAAEGCLSQFSSYMERYYATYLRYDQAGNASDAAKNTKPVLDCMSGQQTGKFYTYDFNGSPGATTYELIATPIGVQQRRDTLCGTLHLNQAGQRDANNPGCW